MVGELVKAKWISHRGNTLKEALSQSGSDPPHSPWRGDVITGGFPNLSTRAELLGDKHGCSNLRPPALACHFNGVAELTLQHWPVGLLYFGRSRAVCCTLSVLSEQLKMTFNVI